MTAKYIEFAKDLRFPIDAATQTFGFLGRKRSGKSYGATKMVEGLVRAKVQTVVLDTVGKLFGLRLDADGKRPGLDMVILGGLRGDIPLSPEAGGYVADAVIDTGRSFIIDVSQFSLAARQRFLHAFGAQLWQRKKAEKHPTPIHILIEEAQLVIPQQVWKGQEQMVGIWEEIVRLGGNYGIGVSLLSQRPQSVNKEVLTQVECLIVFQLNGVPEKKVIKEWVVAKGADVVDLINELPALPRGTAFIWSPQWLEHFGKHQILPKTTFDSTATPKVGVRVRQVKVKPLNLKELEKQMAEVVVRGQQEDPKALRKENERLRDLVKQHELGHFLDKHKLSIHQTHEELYKKWAAHHLEPLRSKYSALRAAKVRELTKAVKAADDAGYRLCDIGKELSLTRSSLDKSTAAWQSAVAPFHGGLVPDAGLANMGEGGGDVFQRAPIPPNYFAKQTFSDGDLRGIPEQLPPGRYSVRIKDAKAVEDKRKVSITEKFEVVGGPRNGAEVTNTQTEFKLVGKMKDMLCALHNKPLSRDDLATVVGMRPGAGGYNNYIGALISEGLVRKEEHDSRLLDLTARGLGLSLQMAPGKYSHELTDVLPRHGRHIIGKMKDMVEVLLKNSSGGQGGTAEQITAGVGMVPGTGGANNYLGALRQRGIFVKSGTTFFINPVLR